VTVQESKHVSHVVWIEKKSERGKRKLKKRQLAFFRRPLAAQHRLHEPFMAAKTIALLRSPPRASLPCTRCMH
jgi:hypothetical protein